MTTAINDTIVQPYLFFDGRCEEALDFYSKTLGAKIECVSHFKDSPDPTMCQPGIDQNKVMHASFRIGGHIRSTRRVPGEELIGKRSPRSGTVVPSPRFIWKVSKATRRINHG